jgi:hypothetical protein
MWSALLTLSKDPQTALALLILAGKVGLLILIAISWLVGWMREPDPKARFYRLFDALGRLSIVTFQDAPGSSKLPIAKWQPKNDSTGGSPDA